MFAVTVEGVLALGLVATVAFFVFVLVLSAAIIGLAYIVEWRTIRRVVRVAAQHKLMAAATVVPVNGSPTTVAADRHFADAVTAALPQD